MIDSLETRIKIKMASKGRALLSNEIIEVTDYWLQDLRRQVQPQYRDGIGTVQFYIRNKPQFLRNNVTENCERKEEVDFPSPEKQQEILEEAMNYAKNSRKEPQDQDIPWVPDKKQIKMLKDTTENVRP